MVFTIELVRIRAGTHGDNLEAQHGEHMVWNDFTQGQRAGSVLEVLCAETGARNAYILDASGGLWNSAHGVEEPAERKELEDAARAELAASSVVDRVAGRWYFLSVSAGFAVVARFDDTVDDVAGVRAAAQRAWRKVEDLPRFGGGDGSPRGTGRID